MSDTYNVNIVYIKNDTSSELRRNEAIQDNILIAYLPSTTRSNTSNLRNVLEDAPARSELVKRVIRDDGVDTVVNRLLFDDDPTGRQQVIKALCESDRCVHAVIDRIFEHQQPCETDLVKAVVRTRIGAKLAIQRLIENFRPSLINGLVATQEGADQVLEALMKNDSQAVLSAALMKDDATRVLDRLVRDHSKELIEATLASGHGNVVSRVLTSEEARAELIHAMLEDEDGVTELSSQLLADQATADSVKAKLESTEEGREELAHQLAKALVERQHTRNRSISGLTSSENGRQMIVQEMLARPTFRAKLMQELLDSDEGRKEAIAQLGLEPSREWILAVGRRLTKEDCQEMVDRHRGLKLEDMRDELRAEIRAEFAAAARQKRARPATGAKPMGIAKKEPVRGGHQ